MSRLEGRGFVDPPMTLGFISTAEVAGTHLQVFPVRLLPAEFAALSSELLQKMFYHVSRTRGGGEGRGGRSQETGKG